MRELIFERPGVFEWRERAAPRLDAATDALVRPLAVARCDLDLYIATGVAPFRGPFAFGHEMVAEVIEAGEASGTAPGARVIVPFQLSCGRCGACRRGWTNSCESYPPYAAFGLASERTDYGGALSDVVRVPFADHMLVPLPSGVDPVVAASVSDNVADGWRGVAGPLAERPGATVLVIGGRAQSVGLYAAGAAVAIGAGRTLYLDDDAGRRARAEAMGAEAAPLTLGEGRDPVPFEIVVEAAGDAAALGFAVRSTAPNGVLTSVAMYWEKTTPLPLTQAYYRGLTFDTGRVHSRAVLPALVECIGCGRLDPSAVTHRVAAFADAPEAMSDRGPKIVFTP